MRFATTFLLALFAIQACNPINQTGNPSAEVPKTSSGQLISASVLANTLQCGNDVANGNAILLTNPQQLTQRYLQLSQTERDSLRLTPVDFSRERVLLITMGQRPSGGYLLNYQQQPIRLDAQNSILDVEVSWQEPLPGYVQAQVLTAPCLLLKLPTLKNLKRIRIWDQENRLKLDIAVPAQ